MAPSYWVPVKKWIEQIFYQGDRNSGETKIFLNTFRWFLPPNKLFKRLQNEIKLSKRSKEKSQALVEFLMIWVEECWKTDFVGSLRVKFFSTYPEGLPCKINEMKLLLIRIAGPKRLKFTKITQMTTTASKSLDSYKDEHENYSYSQDGSGPPTPVVSRRTTIVHSFSMQNIHGIYASNREISLPKSYSFDRRLRSESISDSVRLKVEKLTEVLHLEWISKFKSLKTRHFFDRVWNSKQEKKRKNSLDDITALFNRLSQWVVLAVLNGENRRELLEEIIRMAKNFESKGNYDACMAVVSGLNHYALQRMKNTWNSISEREKFEFENLENLVDPGYNFKGYRESVASHKTPNYIPFLGLILRDLTFLGENERKKGEEINLHFVKTSEKILNPVFQVKRIQFTDPYSPLDKENAKNWMEKSFPAKEMSDEEMYNLSLSAEAPDSEQPMTRSRSSTRSSLSTVEEKYTVSGGSPYAIRKAVSDTFSKISKMSSPNTQRKRDMLIAR
eukprot:TRINITY_DN11449_c0_g1_i1.p1 TRINITY_DN11449_c0_g1~~TRINITY_DN11449_c0_g1_i1.p1  ORF type:complete len:503 (+),score=102.40 TRINITY_DN11449_c0_g1_i1:237-1745(+)